MGAMIVEYSPSGRATCRLKSCGQKIEKGALRLGEEYNNDRSATEYSYTSYGYRHWRCVTHQMFKKIRSNGGATMLGGFTKLSEQDQLVVLRGIERGKYDPADAAFISVLDAPVPGTSSSSNPTAPIEPAATTNKRKRGDTVSSTSSAPPERKNTTAKKLRNDEDYFEDSEEDGEPVTKKKRKHPSTTAAVASVEAQATTSLAVSHAQNEAEVDEEEEGGVDVPAVQETQVYTTFSSDVVGTQYYPGLVDIGEVVILEREPNNLYDRNAIRVLNTSRTQVGHIPRKVAVRLAPLLDSGQVTIDGTMTSSNLPGSGFHTRGNLSVSISVIGPTDAARQQALERSLAWANPGNAPRASQTGIRGLSSGGSSRSGGSRLNAADAERAAHLSTLMNSMTQLDDTNRRDNLLNSLCDEDVLELPLHTSPPSIESGLLHNNLLKHQKQALLWCINAENPKLPTTNEDKPVQFWKYASAGNKVWYHNIATKTPQEAPPVLGRGGIIVVPLSVLSNWSTQIGEHVTEEAEIKAHIYYGDGKGVKPAFLRSQDIVITTYQTIAGEFPAAKREANSTAPSDIVHAKSGLFAVKWKRCVLDEGHTIRNPKTKMAMACFGLDAERRWVVSGTPIINNPSDLGAILRFLRVFQPLNNPEMFTRTVAGPLGRRDLQAVELLRALMSSCCLRRTKDMQDKNGKSLIPLPPLTFNVVKVKLDEETREFYDAVEHESRHLVEDFYARGGQRRDMPLGINILSLLTRLRQIALDPTLLKANYLEDLKASIKALQANDPVQHAPISISPEERARLQQALTNAINDSEECPVCMDSLTNPRITTCAHVYCLACIVEVIERQHACPMDRRMLRVEELLEPAPILPPSDEKEVALELDGVEEVPQSAKVTQLIELLKIQPRGTKSLVFSQFTSFLDKIATALNTAQIPWVRFDGSMSAQKRAAVLEIFSKPLKEHDQPVVSKDDDETEPDTDDEGYDEYWKKRKGKGKAIKRGPPAQRQFNTGTNPVVMLISLKAGALGLNLTVASSVFLMDPWWQEAIESQSIDRAHRLGQQKEVTVYQLIAEDTVEEKVLQIQDRKRELIKQAFSGTKTVQTQRQKKEARLQELVELFGARVQPST